MISHHSPLSFVLRRGKGKKKVEWEFMYDAENEVMRFNF